MPDFEFVTCGEFSSLTTGFTVNELETENYQISQTEKAGNEEKRRN